MDPKFKIKQILTKAVNISEEDLALFFSLCEERTYKEGEFLCKKGTRVNHFNFITSGIARHYFANDANKEFTKNFIFGQRFFVASLSDVIEQTPSKLYCQFLEDSTVLSWDFQAVFSLGRENPKWYKLFYILTSRAFISKEIKEIDTYTLDATKRYQNFLESQIA